MTALADFPHFTNEQGLFKALKAQGFSIESRPPGYRFVSPTGNDVFLHSGSITDRNGSRYKNALKDLVRIGFLPPAEWAKQQRARKDQERREIKREAELATAAEAEAPTEAPAVDTEPDPRRKYVCPACAEQRCRNCIDQELPCAFPYPINLGRHRSTIHATPGVTDIPKPRAPRPSGAPRASKVRVRVDPEIIPSVVGRKTAQILYRFSKFQEETGQLMKELSDEVEQLRNENRELRAFKADVERTAGALYDATTKPRR
jgi:hypothetical protein